MLNRIILALIFIPLLIWVILSGGVLFLILWEIVVGFMLYEFYSMLQQRDIQVFKKMGITLGLLFPLIYFLSDLLPQAKYEKMMYSFLMICFLALILRKILQNNPKNILKEVGFTLFGLIYIVFLFAFLLRILSFPEGNRWVLATFLLVWATDSAAYFVGLSIGRHKLASNISPKKSIEGAVGGLIGAIIMMIAIKLWLLSSLNLPWSFTLFVGLLAGVLGQLGDLTESAIKRDLDIKDSGTILQGHGGFLDRFDSILFVAPVLYYAIRFFIIGH